jgi:tetratricopeptide (TPR) repeat protein
VGSALIRLGRIDDAEAVLHQSLDKVRPLGARKAAVETLETLAHARLFAGDVVGARQLYGDALSAARAAGAERNEANIAINLAEAEFRAGDAATALRLVGEARPILRSLHATRAIINGLSNEAAYLVAQGRYDEARVSAREALAAARDAQTAVLLAFTLQHLAAVGALRPSADAHVCEDRRRAARIVGYVDARLGSLEALREYTEQQEYDAMLPALRDALGEDELAKLIAEGSGWSEDQAVAQAMLI